MSSDLSIKGIWGLQTTPRGMLCKTTLFSILMTSFRSLDRTGIACKF